MEELCIWRDTHFMGISIHANINGIGGVYLKQEEPWSLHLVRNISGKVFPFCQISLHAFD